MADIEVVTATEWTHDNCGGKVDTSGIYWKCEKCGGFVYVAICNGNSDTLMALYEIPDNPTGAVYPEGLLRDIVAVAREFDLFIIADEIYQNLVYNGQKTKPLADVMGDVPGLAVLPQFAVQCADGPDQRRHGNCRGICALVRPP